MSSRHSYSKEFSWAKRSPENHFISTEIWCFDAKIIWADYCAEFIRWFQRFINECWRFHSVSFIGEKSLSRFAGKLNFISQIFFTDFQVLKEILNKSRVFSVSSQSSNFFEINQNGKFRPKRSKRCFDLFFFELFNWSQISSGPWSSILSGVGLFCLSGQTLCLLF